jgi:hypothetical protein
MTRRELATVLLGFTVLTVVMTGPLAFHLGTLARIDNGDGQFSIWNVAWVARTLVVDPLHVYDANILYPHRWTLAYSETNLGAGLLAIPVYWLTKNPYAAHNFVLLVSFVLAGTAMYCLVRYLVGDRSAAAIAGIAFAFCPYVFARTPHIQLLMTAGLPLTMLAFHRLADRPTVARGFVLGLTIAAQALFCGYYAVFAVLMVAFAVLVVASARSLWTTARYWIAAAVAAGTAYAGTWPLRLPYAVIQRDSGFFRSLDAARQFSADWRAYLASSAFAHSWMLGLIGHWKEVLFPGYVVLTFGAAGAVAGWSARGRTRETAILYGGLAVLACWASLGPDAGLYRVLYHTISVFSLLRAPARFGIVVVMGLCVLSAIAIRALLSRTSRPTVIATFLGAATIAELVVPLHFPWVRPVEPAYRFLAGLPRGPVLELPLYSQRFAFLRTAYMLNSTAHWMPLVEGYTDYIPQDFIDRTEVLGNFPTHESFAILDSEGVRYAVFHVDQYRAVARTELQNRLRQFAPYLQRRYADEKIWIFELGRYPN